MTTPNTIAADVLAADTFASSLRAVLTAYPDAARVTTYTYAAAVKIADADCVRVCSNKVQGQYVQFGRCFGQVTVWPDGNDRATWHDVEGLLGAILEDPEGHAVLVRLLAQ
jgi:hypothetical protein